MADPWNQFPLVQSGGTQGEYVPGVNTPDEGLSGTALMAHLQKTDPETAAAIKAMHEGRMPGTGRNIQKLMPLASLAAPEDDPFDAGIYQARQQARKSFTAGGKDWQNLQRYGTTINHAQELMGTIEGLGNTRFAPGYINPVIQGYKNTVGDEGFQAAKARFTRARDALSSELGAAFRAQGLAEADVNRWEQGLHESDSPAALRSGVQEALKLLGGRMETTIAGWNQTFPNKPHTVDSLLDLIRPGMAGTFHSLQRVDPRTGQLPPSAAPGPGAGAPGAPGGAMPTGGLQTQPAASEGAPGGFHEGQTAVNRQTGERIIYRQGQWVPAQ